MVSGERVYWKLIMYLRQLESWDDCSPEIPVIECTLDNWWGLSAEEVENIWNWLQEI